MKRKIFLLAFFLICIHTRAFSWMPITHYHINKEAAGVSDIFNQAGTYPDAFNFMVHWANVAHWPSQTVS